MVALVAVVAGLVGLMVGRDSSSDLLVAFVILSGGPHSTSGGPRRSARPRSPTSSPTSCSWSPPHCAAVSASPRPWSRSPRTPRNPHAPNSHASWPRSGLGRDLSDSMIAMARRMGSKDLEWVVAAIDINRDTGGNLSEILERVGGTIRERGRIARQVRTLTAEGRLSARILMVPPLLILGLAMAGEPGQFRNYSPTASAWSHS